MGRLVQGTTSVASGAFLDLVKCIDQIPVYIGPPAYCNRPTPCKIGLILLLML